MWSTIKALKRSSKLLAIVAKAGISFLVMVCMLSSCKHEAKKVMQTNQGRALGTSYTIKYEVADIQVNYQKKIDSVFEVVNRSMSTYIPASDISRINRGDTTVVVDAYFEEVFNKAKEVWQITHGSFDPTVGALVNAWGFGPERPLNKVSQGEIDSILAFTGFGKISITENNTLSKQHPNVYLDFNALAKGYAIDILGRMLESNAVENYLVEVGGEVLSKGRNTIADKDWIVAIDDPTQTVKRSFVKILTLKDAAMASSGNYRKSRRDPRTGEVYVHTVNPKTGFTHRSNILSTSVIAPTCMEADAYATAFMVMPLEKSKELLQQKKELEAFILYADSLGTMQQYATEGFQERLLD